MEPSDFVSTCFGVFHMWLLLQRIGAWNFNISGAIILGDSQLAYSFSKSIALNLRSYIQQLCENIKGFLHLHKVGREGIANILGPTILGEIGNVKRFSNAKKLIAFAGLDPVVSQSGRFENKSGRISKRGSLLLRHALFLAANTAIQNDDNLK